MHDLTYRGHVDLQNCEDEPIHLLGKLQSHGLLLGFNRKMQLTHYSETANYLIDSKNLKNETVYLSDVLGEKANQVARTFLESKMTSQLHLDEILDIQNKKYRAHWFLSTEELLLVELEKIERSEQPMLVSALSELYEFQNYLFHQLDEEDLAVQAVSSYRKITNFDRVMFYKFDHNGDGEVIAEDRKPGLESFLGLRYPSTDIPSQARRLYVRNKARSIKDVNDDGVPIYSNISDKPIDLTDSIFRNVSPIHIQYLKNMGVIATHANSIIKNDKLWGMIICHHYDGPKSLSFTERVLTSFYASAIGNWLLNKDLKESVIRQMQERNLLENITAESDHTSIKDVIVKFYSELKSALNIDGISFISSSEPTHIGKCLQANNEIEALIKEMASSTEEGGSEIYHDDNANFLCLSDETIGGVAGFKVGLKEVNYIVLYRSEKTEIYNWAGKEEKNSNEENSESILRPRNSFQLWQETVKGKCLPWTKEDKNLIKKLINALNIFEANQISHYPKSIEYRKSVTQLNAENKKLKTELELLNLELKKQKSTSNESLTMQKLKDVVLSNMSHEMRTPLNGIIGLASLIEDHEDSSEEIHQYAQLISKSSYRMHKTFNDLMRLDFLSYEAVSAKKETVSLVTFIDKLLIPIKEIIGANQDLKWRIHNHRERLMIDDRLLGQIIVNLINNSLKYGGPYVHVEVDFRVLWENGRKCLVFSVEDDGPGIDKEFQDKIFEPFYMGNNITNQSDESGGLGLYIVKTYVEFLKGRIELQSELDKGATFYVNIPIKTLS
jgi:light-regulated signal transduction histidine kinase (bacteriophytochrome)